MPSSFRPRSIRPSILSVALAVALHAAPVWAVEPFTLQDIRVEGLQRTDAGTDHWVGRGIAYICDASAEPAAATAGGEETATEPAEPVEGQGLDPELSGE